MGRVGVLAINTFRESIRSKVLYSILFFAIIVVAVSALFGSVTIGDQIVVIKNFGLFSISFFSVAYAVISGSALLHKELSKKTVYNILAKAVKRWEFVVGKYLGMLLTVTIMIVLMALGLFLICALLEQKIDLLLFDGFAGIFFQLMIVCAAAIFFSSIVVTPALSGMFTFGLFVAGRSSDYLLRFVETEQFSGTLATLVEWLHAVLPHLDLLDVSNMIVYGQPASIDFIYDSLCYSAGYSGILLTLATFFFTNREFN